MCVAELRKEINERKKIQANDKQYNNYSHENEMNKTQIKKKQNPNERKTKESNTIAMTKVSIHLHTVENIYKQNYDHKKIEVYITHKHTQR